MSDEVGSDLSPPVKWVRSKFDEPNLDGMPGAGFDYSFHVFLYEFDADGLVLRVVELMGTGAVPIAAASLAEFWEAQGHHCQAATPALQAYSSRYGQLPWGTEADWGDYPREEIPQDEFESAWLAARAHLQELPRDEHFAPRASGT